MKYLLFETSAIEAIINNTSLQSVDFSAGERFVDILYGEQAPDSFESIHIEYAPKEEGVLFVGNRHEKQFLLIDLCQCKLLEIEKKSKANVILVLQKLFRTAIRIWERQPFTSSERINGTKSIIFPFPYTDHRRIVVERRSFHIMFFSHNESTRQEAEYAFSLFQDADLFVSKTIDQWIEFSTLLSYCISIINVNLSQVIERDASEAKQSQRLLIEESFDTIMSSTYKTYRALLSPQLRGFAIKAE